MYATFMHLTAYKNIDFFDFWYFSNVTECCIDEAISGRNTTDENCREFHQKYNKSKTCQVFDKSPYVLSYLIRYRNDGKITRIDGKIQFN